MATVVQPIQQQGNGLMDLASIIEKLSHTFLGGGDKTTTTTNSADPQMQAMLQLLTSGGLGDISKGAFSKDAAVGDSKSIIDGIIKQGLEAAMPSIAQGAKTSGLRSGDTTTGLLTNDLQARLAGVGAKAAQDNIQNYAQISANGVNAAANATKSGSNTSTATTTQAPAVAPKTSLTALAGLAGISSLFKRNPIANSSAAVSKIGTNTGPSANSSDMLGGGDAGGTIGSGGISDANFAPAPEPVYDFSGGGDAGAQSFGGGFGDGNIDFSSMFSDGFGGAGADLASSFGQDLMTGGADFAPMDFSGYNPQDDLIDAGSDFSDFGDFGDFSFFADGGRVPSKSVFDRIKEYALGTSGKSRNQKAEDDATKEAPAPAPATQAPQDKKDDTPPKEFRFANGGRVAPTTLRDGTVRVANRANVDNSREAPQQSQQGAQQQSAASANTQSVASAKVSRLGSKANPRPIDVESMVESNAPTSSGNFSAAANGTGGFASYGNKGDMVDTGEGMSSDTFGFLTRIGLSALMGNPLGIAMAVGDQVSKSKTGKSISGNIMGSFADALGFGSGAIKGGGDAGSQIDSGGMSVAGAINGGTNGDVAGGGDSGGADMFGDGGFQNMMDQPFMVNGQNSGMTVGEFNALPISQRNSITGYTPDVSGGGAPIVVVGADGNFYSMDAVAAGYGLSGVGGANYNYMPGVGGASYSYNDPASGEGDAGGVSVGGGGFFKDGGDIPGHDTKGKDNIQIHVSGGEYVIPTDVVDHLGEDFFNKLLAQYHKPVGKENA